MLKPMEDKLLKVSSVATYLSVSNTTVRKWIKQGILDAIELPSSGKRDNIRIRQSSLLKIINTKETVRS